MLPKNLRGRKDIFKFDFSKTPSWKPYPLAGIFQRFGGPRNNQFFRVLYLLKDQKHTRPRWDLSSQVESVFEEYFDQYFNEGDLDSFSPNHAGSVGGSRI